MARSKPELIGIITTVLLHGIAAMVCALIIVTVKPMTSLPIEVELLGFGEAISPDRDDLSDPGDSDPISMPDLRRESPFSQPVPREIDQPLPILPESDPIGQYSIPPLSERVKHTPAPSPSSRIGPIPIAAEDDSTVESRVQVRLEGLLSTRRLIHMVRPVFPPDVPMGGEVKIHLEVASDGTVELARVIQKAHPRFDESAVRAVRQWRFAADEETTTAEGNVTIYFEVN